MFFWLDIIALTQHNSCVMIPSFVDIGSPWRVLPPGIHNATLEDIKDKFTFSSRRKRLYQGLCKATTALRKAGCTKIYLDGSFVTEKENPGDYDVCWEETGVEISKIDPVFLDFEAFRKRQKERFYGEFFPAHTFADHTYIFLDFFQNDRFTGEPKGIICIDISNG